MLCRWLGMHKFTLMNYGYKFLEKLSLLMDNESFFVIWRFVWINFEESVDELCFYL